MEDQNVKRTKSNLLSSIRLRLKALLDLKRGLTRRRHIVSAHPDTDHGMEQGAQKQRRHVLGFMDLPFEIRSYIYSEYDRRPA